MGLDLRLYIIEGAPQAPYSHTILSCEAAGILFDEILKLEKQRGQPVPNDLTSWVNDSYSVIDKTDYGEPVQTLTIVDLETLKTHPDVLESQKNRAVWAYLQQCASRTRVALYWH
jgi:hypothetical protein